MFQRFTVVMEYQQKPVLPPPFIGFCHCYSLLKYFIRKAKGLQEVRDNGLKLFLEKDDLERLYDFEEECVEGYFHEQNSILMQSTDERIKNTDERVENMYQKIDDINQKENLQSVSVQNMEFRLRKMEESTEQILSHLAVIHRFMSTHINQNIQGSMANISFPVVDHRLRTMSENDTGALLPVPREPRKRFMRSLTEVRPDAYIFDEGSHFEVRTVIEENEVSKTAEENLNELGIHFRCRKLSVQSEEPEFINSPIHTPLGPSINTPIPSPPEQIISIPNPDSMARRPPTLSIRQETKETNSTESKDTLTPLETCEERTLVGDQMNDDNVDASYEGLRQRSTARRRNSIVGGRRNSESQSNYDINRSQNSLNILSGVPVSMTKRQFSLTQSEPDTDGPIPPAQAKPAARKTGRNLLLQIHAEYTSITDELESMIASPTNSLDEKPKNINELSNPEFAAMIETRHLKECEDNDYMMLERLLETRNSIDESDENVEGFASEFTNHRRMLRRETAIELPITPSKSHIISMPSDDVNKEKNTDYQNRPTVSRNVSSEITKLSPLSNQNSPRNSRYLPNASYLNPEEHQRLYKKSCESLQKNSSSDTEYSLQPYKVMMKQNSNDTNSSINIDNSSFTNDLPIDAESILNTTVIENTAEDRALTKKSATVGTSDVRQGYLRKQFSIDHGKKIDSVRPLSENLETKMSGVKALDTLTIPPPSPSALSVGPLQSKSNSRLQTNILQESSSISTEDPRETRKLIPGISTHTVQDEIAKLSSNIKSSTDDPNPIDEPFNETMC